MAIVCKLLELFGFWAPRRTPVYYVGNNSCETLDSLLVLKIISSAHLNSNSGGRKSFE